MKKENRVEQYLMTGIHIAIYCILPMIGFMTWVLCVPILFYGGMITSVDDAQGLGQTLLVFSAPMLLFFVAIPVLFQLRRVSVRELGIKFSHDKKNIVILGINCFIVIILLGKLVLNFNSLLDALPIVFQLCTIGISEEILCRGIIYHEIESGFGNKWFAVILSSMIFAFLFHSGDTDLANLAIRFPLGLTLALVRCYTGNVYSSIMMHIWYNSWMFIL